MKEKLLLLLFCFCGCIYGIAQSLSPSVLASQGAISQGDNFSLEWTLGELAVATIRTPDGMLTEGFHQPVLKVEELTSLTEGYQITLAPNPVKSILSVDIRSETEAEVTMQLLNLNGQPLQIHRANFPFETTELDLSNYPSGLYFLRFSEKDGKLLKTFKITKVR